MLRKTFLITICLMLGVVATACSSTSDSNDASPSTAQGALTPALATATPTPRPTPTLTPKPSKAVAVEYYAASDPLNAAIIKDLEDERSLEILATWLNQTFIFPEVLTLSLKECDEANAFYYPDGAEIIMCAELVTFLYDAFYPYASTEEELGLVIERTFMYFFYHEVGHALIDILELPTTGREEDAADQLAALVLLEADNPEYLEAAVSFFVITGKDQMSASWDAPLWDEHSLDMQRAYDLLCLGYGYDPEYFALSVEDLGYLPAQRAQGCQAEYNQISSSWESLLKPHRTDSYTGRPKTQPTPVPTTAVAQCDVDLSGAYEGTATLPSSGAFVIRADFRQTGCQIEGELTVPLEYTGSGPFTGSISGRSVDFVVEGHEIVSSMLFEDHYSGTVATDGLLHGQAVFSYRGDPTIYPPTSWTLAPLVH